VLLPTGSGKSLICQLSSLIGPGKIVVVSPLISLMQDRIDNLFYQGIDSVSAIYHGNTTNLSEESLSDPRLTLTYISPERLQVRSFRDSIDNLVIKNSVFAVAVDEAHCVSEWGHDFRTAYLNIGRISRDAFQKNGRVPVIVALTGTASTAVLKDVQRELNIHEFNAIITPTTFDRKELSFQVFKSSSASKQRLLNSIINDYIPMKFKKNSVRFYGLNNNQTNAGIVFCPHVNGDFGVQKVCNSLTIATPTNYYSGSAPKGFRGNWEEEKRKASSAFKSNQINLLVATKAFGMGIDKPNVRFTIHYDVPGSIESFYQEAGRAGRDGKEAWCVIIFSNDNHGLNERLLDPATPLEYISKIVDEQSLGDKDDISRVLYFHINSFKGVKYELERVSEVANVLCDDGKLTDHSVILKCSSNEKDNNSFGNVQKALQRMLILGIVSDYTVDYSNKEISVKPGKCDDTSLASKYENYVKGYNEGRVMIEIKRLNDSINSVKKNSSNYIINYIIAAAKVLIDFVYDTIEKGRRRGLREIVKLAESALSSHNQDIEVRTRIIRYFESTYSIELNSVVSSPDLGFDRIPIIFDGQENDVREKYGGIRSENEAMGLRGQVSRYLESTPDHPGLLALRALSELFCKDYDKKSIEIDYAASIEFALERYSYSKERLIDFFIYFIKKAFDRDADIVSRLFDKTSEYIDSDILCLRCLDSNGLTDKQKTVPAYAFFNNKAKYLLGTIKKMKGDQ
jgi:ATP-dependent DNA helicase RecQ